MNNMLKKSIAALLSVLALCASHIQASEIEAIENVIKQSEAAVNSAAPDKWAEIMYSDKVIVVGEGAPASIRGLDALMPTIKGVTSSVKRCSINVNDARVTDQISWAFATWMCQPTEGEPFSVRALYVLEKEQSGWKVTAEMYTMGEM